MTAPLRIGVLGARDRTRAEAFAAEHGISTVHDGYAGVIADPGVDLVYNALVNSQHARWNIAALPAGMDEAVANAELIDQCYRRAGLSPPRVALRAGRKVRAPRVTAVARPLCGAAGAGRRPPTLNAAGGG